MRTFMLALVLVGTLTVIAQGQMTVIEGYVVPGVEAGCWILNDVWTGTTFNLFGGGPDLYQPGVWATVWGIPHPDWVTYCMQGMPFEVTDYELGGFDAWWWPPETCTVTPPQPTCADPLAITAGGDWPDSCPPYGSEIAVVGDEVFWEVIHDYPSGIMCFTVISPWSLTEHLDPLPAGSYTIYAALIGHPLVPETPTPVLTFTVAPNGADIDCDRDMDLDDFTMLADHMTGPAGVVRSPCGGADLDRDNDVDLVDVQIFQTYFSPPRSPRIGDYSNSGCLEGSRDEYPWCGDDQIELAVEGNTLHVAHRNATYNCCPDDIVISLSVEGNVLRLTEEEILTMPCACLCCYDIEATVVDLAPGTYTVEFCWQDWETSEQQCYAEDILIP